MQSTPETLTEVQVIDTGVGYQACAAVYDLAAEFNCHRTIVAAGLENAGIAMGSQPPTPEAPNSMVRLCELPSRLHQNSRPCTFLGLTVEIHFKKPLPALNSALAR